VKQGEKMGARKALADEIFGGLISDKVR